MYQSDENQDSMTGQQHTGELTHAWHAFLDDWRLWRRHVDEQERAEDRQFLDGLLEIGEVMTSLPGQQRSASLQDV